MFDAIGTVIIVISVILFLYFFASSLISCFAHTMWQAMFLRTPYLYNCAVAFAVILTLFIWSLLKCPIPDIIKDKDVKDNKYCPNIYEKFYNRIFYILIGISVFAGIICIIKRLGYLSFLPFLKSCDPFDPDKMDIGWNILLFVIFIILAIRISKVFIEVATDVQKYS